ncbi:hypothetical protein FRC09_000885 [Ceratobasidium sp. 395]|nr:hypothetical protein FRC09_000885 [Ceratobasidium sp. 395]
MVEMEIQELTASAILRAAYGYEVESSNDPFVLSIKSVVEIVSQIALPGNFLVNLIPTLLYAPEWLPGTSWKRKARGWRAQKDQVLNETFAWTKNQMAQGMAKPSILRSILENIHESKHEDPQHQEEAVKEVALALFGAGSDTTAGTLMAFVLAMVRFPEVQTKAQQEIDAVIGPNRLPEISDRPNLTYVGNIVQEVLRWRPVVPMGERQF